MREVYISYKKNNIIIYRTFWSPIVCTQLKSLKGFFDEFEAGHHDKPF